MQTAPLRIADYGLRNEETARGESYAQACLVEACGFERKYGQSGELSDFLAARFWRAEAALVAQFGLAACVKGQSGAH